METDYITLLADKEEEIARLINEIKQLKSDLAYFHNVENGDDFEEIEVDSASITDDSNLVLKIPQEEELNTPNTPNIMDLMSMLMNSSSLNFNQEEEDDEQEQEQEQEEDDDDDEDDDDEDEQEQEEESNSDYDDLPELEPIPNHSDSIKEKCD